MELNRGAVVRESMAASDDRTGMAVHVDAASFSWDDNVVDAKQEVLRAVNLGIRSGTLAMVVGMVGSGKSSLLACILGEMRKLCGTVMHTAPTAIFFFTNKPPVSELKNNCF
jgi:ATP-binding cassette subfamily C (CFTR/MRP) protein 1